MNNIECMKLALEEAYAGVKEDHGGPFGAVVVKDGQVVASAHNTVLRDNDPTKHAEVKAISEASRKLGTFDLSGCVIYSTNEPCPMCFSAIHWARVDKVIFGTSIEDVAKRGFHELMLPCSEIKEKAGSLVEIEAGFMQGECEELLNYWDNIPDKKTY